MTKKSLTDTDPSCPSKMIQETEKDSVALCNKSRKLDKKTSLTQCVLNGYYCHESEQADLYDLLCI